MITIEKLNFSYNNSKPILSALDLQINQGESVGIVGANGVGKSTLLKLLVGLELEYQGKIKIKDLEVKKQNLKAIRKIIGYVFQNSDSQLFMPTIYEDIAFAPKNYGYKTEEVERRTLKALQAVGLENIKNMPIYHLSGGQKKLVALATILSMNPEILIFDEPTVALDPRNRKRFIKVFKELSGTKIITSHDLDLIYDTCKRTILLAQGRIVKDGLTKEILTDQELLENNGLELPLSFSRK